MRTFRPLPSFLAAATAAALALGSTAFVSLATILFPLLFPEGATAQSCTQAPSGLLYWWPGNGDAFDIEGGKHGTLVNGATFAPGLVGQGFSFDGVNDFVSIPGSLGGGPEVTVEAWFKTTGTNNADFYAIVSSSTNQNEFLHLQLFSAGGIAVYTNTGLIVLPVVPQTPTGVFRHIALSVKSGDTRLYVDGNLFGSSSQTFSYVVPTQNPRIGAGYSGGRFFKGVIDEVSVYDRALSAAEVGAIFQAGAAGKCNVLLDADPPAVVILSPGDGAVVAVASVTVTAQVTDASATTIVSSPVGVSASLPAGGGLAAGTVPLAEGPNLMVVSATDASGNVGGTSVTVIRDTIAPQVTIVSPIEGAIFGDSPVALTVSVSDATATSVSFGANAFALPAGGGVATGDVALTEGPNTIVVSVTDAAGNPASATVQAVLDLTAPLVTIDSPADGACFGPGESPIAVMATVDDLTATTVDSIPPGVSGSLPAGGGIAAGAIALVEGSNPLQVRATDATGRTGSASITVLLDTTPPEVSVLSPVDGAAVRGTIDFDASAMDVAPGTSIARVDFTVDGDLFTSITTPPFETALDTMTLSDGLHALEVGAVDGKANASMASVHVVVDNTPPALAISNPYDGALVGGTVAFEVAASDSASGLSAIEMLAGGVAPTGDASIAYAPAVSSDERVGSEDTTRWPDGPLTLGASVRDAAGNEASASVTITVDNTAPAKALLSPTDGSVVSGVLSILGHAQDPALDTLEILVDGVSVGASSLTPFSVAYDTRTRLDGAMTVTVIARDLVGNTSTCTATVTVDNVSVRLDPQTLNLKSKGKENSFTCFLEGASLALVLPTEAHALELRVPGGNAVPSTAGFAGDDSLSDPDDDGVPDLVLKFDRQKLIASIQAGIAGGMIQPDSNVTLSLVANGSFVMGTDVVRINSK